MMLCLYRYTLSARKGPMWDFWPPYTRLLHWRYPIGSASVESSLLFKKEKWAHASFCCCHFCFGCLRKVLRRNCCGSSIPTLHKAKIQPSSQGVTVIKVDKYNYLYNYLVCLLSLLLLLNKSMYKLSCSTCQLKFIMINYNFLDIFNIIIKSYVWQLIDNYN